MLPISPSTGSSRYEEEYSALRPHAFVRMPERLPRRPTPRLASKSRYARAQRAMKCPWGPKDSAHGSQSLYGLVCINGPRPVQPRLIERTANARIHCYFHDPRRDVGAPSSPSSKNRLKLTFVVHHRGIEPETFVPPQIPRLLSGLLGDVRAELLAPCLVPAK
jgi:hypothetical protein